MKLIVLDGTDGTGKQTQSTLLKENLEKLGFKTKLIAFPNYEDDSSILLKRYLNGIYGNNAEQVNPFSASILYSVDRLNFFLTEDLSDTDVLLCDRYTTSNLVHQLPKLSSKKEQQEYQDWLEDLEYGKLNLPKPDAVFYLDLNPEIAEELVKNRANSGKDIHESNHDYLKKCSESAREIAKDNGWELIECDLNGRIRSIEDIQEEILAKALNYLNNEPIRDGNRT